MLKRMAVVAALVLPLLPATARAADLNQDLAWCTNSGTASEQAILGCTAAIQSGKLDQADQFWVLDNRGVAYANLHEYARAVQDFDQVIRLRPDDFDAFANRGAAYRLLGQYARSIPDYDVAIRLNPGFARAYRGRSLSKRALGDATGADEDLAKAKAIDPSIGGSGNSSSQSPNAPADNATATPNAPAANNTAPGSDTIEVEYWRSIENSKNPADFEAYLKKFPSGHFADLAWNRLDALRAPTDVCGSMVGTWSWFTLGDVTFNADGTAANTSGFKATWTCHNGDVKIFWPLGDVDTLTLSPDGRHLRGHGGFLGLSEVTGDRK